MNKAHDILVFGSGDSIEEAEKDHDINLWNLMLRCLDVNLKLNPKKVQFKVKQVTWMGHLLSMTGVTPRPDRVQAIKDMTSPHNVKGAQRFLGVCKYLSRFTPNLAEVVKPLTELTHGKAVWSWSSQHDKAFKTAKRLIANAAKLKFFDVNKPCVLQVDASDTGLGVPCCKMVNPSLLQVQHCQQLNLTMQILKRNVWPSKWPVKISTSIFMVNKML